MSIDKIGMYKTDEILEFMTEGEGRGFLGRSMFDAMYFEIERLNNIINKAIESVQEHYDNSYSTDDVNDIGSGTYDDLMEILKGVDKN